MADSDLSGDSEKFLATTLLPVRHNTSKHNIYIYIYTHTHARARARTHTHTHVTGACVCARLVILLPLNKRLKMLSESIFPIVFRCFILFNSASRSLATRRLPSRIFSFSICSCRASVQSCACLCDAMHSYKCAHWHSWRRLSTCCCQTRKATHAPGTGLGTSN